jgi:hypothetical protein
VRPTHSKYRTPPLGFWIWNDTSNRPDNELSEGTVEGQSRDSLVDATDGRD